MGDQIIRASMNIDIFQIPAALFYQFHSYLRREFRSILRQHKYMKDLTLFGPLPDQIPVSLGKWIGIHNYSPCL